MQEMKATKKQVLRTRHGGGTGMLESLPRSCGGRRLDYRLSGEGDIAFDVSTRWCEIICKNPEQIWGSVKSSQSSCHPGYLRNPNNEE
ncbi:C-X-C motif chemokine 9 isoform X3 [Felis catus]|uniref:C-X-C motif chemokine 9 isoform X3 n=1 Tax=Felis catus TaxID=9685 RepID=UPI001D19AD33|nr:C-X-C motif chemokine 9 isoform X3 [Felis catus]